MTVMLGVCDHCGLVLTTNSVVYSTVWRDNSLHAALSLFVYFYPTEDLQVKTGSILCMEVTRSAIIQVRIEAIHTTNVLL